VIPDPHAPLRDELTTRALEGPAHTSADLRAAAAKGGAGLPEDLRDLVQKIHRGAYAITDDDLARLKARYTDDELFEIIVSAALGASMERVGAGMRALTLALEAK
jgi:hypothetical protein